MQSKVRGWAHFGNGSYALNCAWTVDCIVLKVRTWTGCNNTRLAGGRLRAATGLSHESPEDLWWKVPWDASWEGGAEDTGRQDEVRVLKLMKGQRHRECAILTTTSQQKVWRLQWPLVVIKHLQLSWLWSSSRQGVSECEQKCASRAGLAGGGEEESLGVGGGTGGQVFESRKWYLFIAERVLMCHRREGEREGEQATIPTWKSVFAEHCARNKDWTAELQKTVGISLHIDSSCQVRRWNMTYCWIIQVAYQLSMC